MYCVIDTERIKGNQIYLFSYQLYNDDFKLIESKTFQDVSIDVSNRKSPKRKVKELDSISIKVGSFKELYENVRYFAENNLTIVFSLTDVHTLKRNCKDNNIEYKKIKCIDLQEVLYNLSEDEKHKSNLNGYCEVNGIKHNPHIPESDCEATFKLFQDLIKRFGIDYLLSIAKEC